MTGGPPLRELGRPATTPLLTWAHGQGLLGKPPCLHRPRCSTEIKRGNGRGQETPLRARPRWRPAPASPTRGPGSSRPIAVSLGAGSSVSSRSDISCPQGEVVGRTDPLRVQPPAQVRGVPKTSLRGGDFCTVQSPRLASEAATHGTPPIQEPECRPRLEPSSAAVSGRHTLRERERSHCRPGALPRGEPGVQLRRSGARACSGDSARGGPGGPRHLWGPSSHGRRRGGSL